jgi:hypothetical protein
VLAQSDYNYGRLIVVPYPAGEGGGGGGNGSASSWKWEEVEGLRYLFKPDERLDRLGADSPLSGLLDNSTVLGVMEFEKGGNVSLEELLEMYRDIKTSDGASPTHHRPNHTCIISLTHFYMP